MADYYSLLAKLLDSLPDATPQVRQGVYERARRALREQLKTVQPSLTAEDIEREASGLEDAIGKLESRFGSGPETPSPATSAPPTPVEAAAPATLPNPPAAPERAPPSPAPSLRASPIAVRTGRRRPLALVLPVALVGLAIPVGLVAWLWRGDRPAPTPSSPPAQSAPPQVGQSDQKYDERVAGGPPSVPATGRVAAPVPSSATSRQDATAPNGSGTRATTTQPSTPSIPGDRPPAAPGVEAPPAASVTVRPGPAQPSPPPAPPPAASAAPASSSLAVAQRAMIFEENQIDPQQPIISAGRAIWQLDSLSGGQGMPLETVIRGRVDLPGAGLSLSVVVRRNLDTTLPASHTMELSFTSASVNGSPPRIVRDVALPALRPDETIRGVPVAGLPVPVKENVFLIGLSDLKADIDRNTELLLHRNWIELPIRFASGQKAALLFDKGVSGERVFLDAFRQWGQAP